MREGVRSVDAVIFVHSGGSVGCSPGTRPSGPGAERVSSLVTAVAGAAAPLSGAGR
ncbi:hypothetical protein [Nocardia sp. NPDC047654]|uniref:hypothetical protein n=1 Tax=Nocardia sp. NPDC047654 TaxID=3364314 RepID=UPI003722FC9F